MMYCTISTRGNKFGSALLFFSTKEKQIKKLSVVMHLRTS